MKEFLSDLSQKAGFEIKAIFTLKGKRIKTLIQIPMYAKVIITSNDKEFKGLGGINKIEADLRKHPERAESQLKEPEENTE